MFVKLDPYTCMVKGIVEHPLERRDPTPLRESDSAVRKSDSDQVWPEDFGMLVSQFKTQGMQDVSRREQK